MGRKVGRRTKRPDHIGLIINYRLKKIMNFLLKVCFILIYLNNIIMIIIVKRHATPRTSLNF
jgi:hypothetical protein